jgi:hypothetical protein
MMGLGSAYLRKAWLGRLYINSCWQPVTYYFSIQKIGSYREDTLVYPGYELFFVCWGSRLPKIAHPVQKPFLQVFQKPS